ncbi:MAG TPA: hypothetical protein ENK41_01840 [Rhodobacteraceae bacterium]|nr:hypothetical protein [Paracoccaceae bacterium]
MDMMVRTCNRRRSRALLEAGSCRTVCALGRAGIRPEHREGDGATPAGRYPVRMAFYRPDRLPRPGGPLAKTPLRPDFGWCDDPRSPLYNRPVRLPFAGSAEHLWREDHLYDVIVVLGINDDPVLRGKGSALFFHIARPGHAPTEGCIAISMAAMRKILPRITPSSHMIIG